MKLLVNCDQVFEVLTRGPFPTGEPTDEAVEQHLGACHECRQLAEALRPAIALLHEAVSKEEALELPEYQGILPEPDPFENENNRPLSLGIRRLDRRPHGTVPVTHLVSSKRSPSWDSGQLVNVARLIAASVLVVALGWLAWGLAISSRQPGTSVAASAPSGTRAPAALDRQGFTTLVSLKLPAGCLPEQGSLLDEVGGPSSIAAEALRCCTDCHRTAGSARTQVAGLIQFTQACSACHRG